MTYPLTPAPYSITTADGYLAKNDKTQAFNYLSKDYADTNIPPEADTLTVYDGNACFHSLKDIPGNFSQISAKLFGMIGKAGDLKYRW